MMSSKQRLNHFSFDFQVERSVARLNLKCQMFHFDLMEEKKTDHILASILPSLL